MEIIDSVKENEVLMAVDVVLISIVLYRLLWQSKRNNSRLPTCITSELPSTNHGFAD